MKRPNRACLVSSVTLLSILVISYQIALMRSLSFLSYSHFTTLIVSLALLGFGSSGTFLFFLDLKKREKAPQIVSLLFLLLTLSLPLSYWTAELIPLDIQYLFFGSKQVLFFFLTALLLFIPFFLGASVIGSCLVLFQENIPELYGANLLGSGIGGVLPLLLSPLVAVHLLPIRLTGIALLAWTFWISAFGKEIFSGTRKAPAILIILSVFGIGITAASLVIHPEIEPDRYKTISYLKLLEAQGQAKRLYTDRGSLGRIDLYASGSFHNTLFAGPQTKELPPKQLLLLVNGETGGTIFLPDGPEGAKILDYTPQSLPYRLYRQPKVLILGERGGTNILLARRFSASSITVVQPNRQIIRLWEGLLPALGVDLFTSPDLRIVEQDPRLYLKTARGKWDIIHIAESEGMPALEQGIRASREDFLLTVEGMKECLNRLAEGGAVSVTRGVQNPPRDNIKILALFQRALEETGKNPPGDYVMQGRNYLAANSLLFVNPPTEERRAEYENALESLGMDVEWIPRRQAPPGVQKNKVPGPPGESYSFYHHAALLLFRHGGERLQETWLYNITPSTDDKPYFHNFFRWKSLGTMMSIFGTQWYRSSELGFLILLVTFAGTLFFASVFILIPHVRKKTASRPQERGTFPRLTFFFLIGAGYMFIEMIYIQKLTVFLGDPVYSASAVITSILVFSGLGTVLQKKIDIPPEKKIRRASLFSVGILGLSIFLFSPFVNMMAKEPVFLRYILAVLYTAPLSFFLGWFFVSALASLSYRHSEQIPLAWGINGFASVAAVPLAGILSMTLGFTAVLLMAGFMYAAAGSLTLLWTRAGQEPRKFSRP